VNKCQQKRCLRCGEMASEKVSSEYRCRVCGYVENKKPKYSESIDALEERADRTLDLVEIFNFSMGQKRSRT